MRKLEAGAMVLGTAMPSMRAAARAVKRVRAVVRRDWGRIVSGLWMGCRRVRKESLDVFEYTRFQRRLEGEEVRRSLGSF